MLQSSCVAVDRRICRAIKAVEVRLRTEGQDDHIQAIIPQEVFEYELDAGGEPDGWLQAFDKHRPMLEALIRCKHAARHTDFVVVRRGDLRTRP